MPKIRLILEQDALLLVELDDRRRELPEAGRAHLLAELEKTALSWKISDHYPLWTEFSVR